MNNISLKFCAKSQNESFARTVAAAFILPLNPSVEEINDVKTAVSEAVTNAVVHAYGEDGAGEIEMRLALEDRVLHIVISDFGRGIESVDEALEPFFTTRADEERSGMGFTIMKTFMDELRVSSKPGLGTCVEMTKKFA